MFYEGDGKVSAWTLGVDRLGTGAAISLFNVLCLNTSGYIHICREHKWLGKQLQRTLPLLLWGPDIS